MSDTPSVYETDLGAVIGRTQLALKGLDRLFDGSVTYDAKRIAEMMERFREATPGPWIAVTMDKAFDNWPVVFTSGGNWAVTTHNVHASEKVRGGAKEDATFVANAWDDLRYLVKLVQQQQDELWRLRAKEVAP